MLGLVVQFCTAQKETDIIKRHKVNLPYSCCFWFFFLPFYWGLDDELHCFLSWRSRASLSVNSVGMHWLKLWNEFIKQVGDMWVCAFTQSANTAAFSLAVGIKGCSWLSVGFECWAGVYSREHWFLLNSLMWGWDQSFCLVDGAVFQSKVEWSVEPGQWCAEGCVGCLMAVIAVFACSECSSGFLREDHPNEQDKASEACAGETYSYRPGYTSVPCAVSAAVLSTLSPLQDSCSPLLRYISHAEFKELLLPTLQKSLLRSPENVIESECHHCTLLCQSAGAVVSPEFWSCEGCASLWTMPVGLWA